MTPNMPSTMEAAPTRQESRPRGGSPPSGANDLRRGGGRGPPTRVLP